MGGDELRRLRTELRASRLRRDDWDAIAGLLDRVADGDEAALDELSTLVFEAKVRGRFVGSRGVAGLEPTKQTTVLPWVGLICGALLFGVGALLGGGPILVGVAVLSLFVFGVAFAGSRVAHRPRSGERDAAADDDVPPVTAPPEVLARLDHLAA